MRFACLATTAALLLAGVSGAADNDNANIPNDKTSPNNKNGETLPAPALPPGPLPPFGFGGPYCCPSPCHVCFPLYTFLGSPYDQRLFLSAEHARALFRAALQRQGLPLPEEKDEKEKKPDDGEPPAEDGEDR